MYQSYIKNTCLKEVYKLLLILAIDFEELQINYVS